MRTPRPWALPTQPATRSLLRAAGVTGEMLTTQLRSGRLLRLRRGVFLAASAWPADPVAQHVVLAHAEVVANPEAVISRHSAAVVWKLPAPSFVPWHEAPVSVSLPAGAGYRTRSNGAALHVEQLPPDEVVRDSDGYAVTSLARTAVDLAAGHPLPDALVILDAAARGLCASFVASPRRSDFANRRLVEAARAQLAGVAAGHRLPRLLPAIALADPARESAAESLSAGHFQLAGVPTPLFQPPVRTEAGTLFPDCLWPEKPLVGECDGAVKYRDTAAIVHEKEREQVLRDLGFDVVRWQAREIMTRPDLVVDRVLRALAK